MWIQESTSDGIDGGFQVKGAVTEGITPLAATGNSVDIRKAFEAIEGKIDTLHGST